jgi:teichuronic acid biosynthesis glycosyltransferase TuaG
MKVNFLVSIIVPTHNPGEEIFQTVDSLINQTYQNIEIILINDGSDQTEVLKKVIKIYKTDKRFKVISQKNNLGGGYARNIGIGKSKGEYIAFCDSDDWWPKNKIELHLQFMIEKNLSISHTDILVLKKKNNFFSIKKRITQNEIDLKKFLLKTDIFCSTVIVKKEILENCSFGLMKARHPFKFWVNILEKGFKSYKFENCYTYYLKRNTSVSSNKLKMFYYNFFAYFKYVSNKRLALFCFIIRNLRFFFLKD